MEATRAIRYSDALIEQALFKVYSRGERTVTSVAEELNVNYQTVKNWMKRKTVGSLGVSPAKEKRPQG
ncbi:MAG: transposase [Gallionella sp.]